MQKAIILAAGVGKRLGELTKDIPKCLLSIDFDTALVDFSLSTLFEHDIYEIVFVTGFAHEKLKEYIDKKWGRKLSCNFIFNEKYNEYNNIYSAYLAKDFWDDETILLNSDIIFHPAILSTLISKVRNQGRINPAPTRSYLLIDNTKRLSLEDMKVKINSKGQIKEISKNLNIENSLGEYIGIAYLKGLERVKFLESIEKNVKERHLDIYYEDALGQILSEVFIYPLSTEGKIWCEVDTKEDYELAKKIAKEIKTVAIK